MLVLLKTAFYVAGWVMGVNGFGKRRVFFFFWRKVHSSVPSCNASYPMGSKLNAKSMVTILTEALECGYASLYLPIM